MFDIMLFNIYTLLALRLLSETKELNQSLPGLQRLERACRPNKSQTGRKCNLSRILCSTLSIML